MLQQAAVLQCVSAGGWRLSERCMRRRRRRGAMAGRRPLAPI
eukprot:SAG25_NODE_186_length_12406_cov_7.083530_19_plen_42_part_00